MDRGIGRVPIGTDVQSGDAEFAETAESLNTKDSPRFSAFSAMKIIDENQTVPGFDDFKHFLWIFRSFPGASAVTVKNPYLMIQRSNIIPVSPVA